LLALLCFAFLEGVCSIIQQPNTTDGPTLQEAIVAELDRPVA